MNNYLYVISNYLSCVKYDDTLSCYEILLLGPNSLDKTSFLKNISFNDNTLYQNSIMEPYDIDYSKYQFTFWHTNSNTSFNSVIFNYFRNRPPDLCLVIVNNYTSPSEFERYNCIANELCKVSNSSKLVIINTKLRGFDYSTMEGYCIRRNILNIKLDITEDYMIVLDTIVALL